MTINLASVYSADRQAKLAKADEYIRKAVQRAKHSSVVTLTGNAPVWLYLKVAHALHGIVITLYYESPVTGMVEIFNHDPYTPGANGSCERRK